jgi:hypothetical protein
MGGRDIVEVPEGGLGLSGPRRRLNRAKPFQQPQPLPPINAR